MRWDNPPVSINVPARIKKGTAIKGKLSTEVKAPWAKKVVGIPPAISAAIVDTPMAMAMGTPRSIVTTKAIPNIAGIDMMLPSFAFILPAAMKEPGIVI
jgi:hypothetical protein